MLILPSRWQDSAESLRIDRPQKLSMVKVNKLKKNSIFRLKTIARIMIFVCTMDMKFLACPISEKLAHFSTKIAANVKNQSG